GGAIDQVSRQRRDAARLLALDLLPLRQASHRLLDGELDDLLALVGMLVQPQLERVAHAHLHQLRRVAGGELLLGLAVELGAHDARREREAGALPQVVGDELHALGRERARVHEGRERIGIRLTWLSAKISPSATQPIAHEAPSPGSMSEIFASAFWSKNRSPVKSGAISWRPSSMNSKYCSMPRSYFHTLFCLPSTSS